MGHKMLELNIISAKDLKNVNLIGKMDVYVIVSLSGDPKSKQKTPVHQDGGTCPSWNHKMKFSIDESVAVHQEWVLIFQLRHEHTFGADKDLGEVRVPVNELFGSGRHNNIDPQFVTYQVKKPSGKPQGELKFSYKFSDVADGMMYAAGQKMNHPSVVNAYPPQSCSSSSYHPPAAGQPVTAAPYPPTAGAYPPPPAGYPQQGGYPPQQGGYPPQQGGYPPQQGGYPPQQGGYYPPPPAGYPPPAAAQGYPPPQYGGYPPQAVGGQGYGGYPPQAGYSQMQQPQKPAKNKKNNKMGMGLGAGLLGGALGGLVIGEALEDIGDFDC